MDRIKDDKYYLEKVVKDIKYLLRVTKDVSKTELDDNKDSYPILKMVLK